MSSALYVLDPLLMGLPVYGFTFLFLLNLVQFNQICTKVTPLWKRQVLGKYKRPGRNFALSLEDMILMLLLYYRSYITQMFVGYLFGLDDSRVCRIIQKLEPLLAKVMAIPKEKYLSQEEIEETLVDATEQPIERPKKGQKPYYSGKKKRHTLKTEIRTTLKGRITHVSKSRPEGPFMISICTNKNLPCIRRAEPLPTRDIKG